MRTNSNHLHDVLWGATLDLADNICLFDYLFCGCFERFRFFCSNLVYALSCNTSIAAVCSHNRSLACVALSAYDHEIILKNELVFLSCKRQTHSTGTNAAIKVTISTPLGLNLLGDSEPLGPFFHLPGLLGVHDGLDFSTLVALRAGLSTLGSISITSLEALLSLLFLLILIVDHGTEEIVAQGEV